MLVLARSPSQRIRITTPEGRVIWLTLIEIRHMGQARIGIDADREVVIEREKLIQDHAARDRGEDAG